MHFAVFCVFLCTLVFALAANHKHRQHPHRGSVPRSTDRNDYIVEGLWEDGFIGNATSYAGYLLADAEFNGNLFFWFFTAQSGNKNAPTLLWLNGGPGSSSLFGLFVEHGPFRVTDSGSLFARSTSWNVEYNMLYIDNPVGVGYSFTDSPSGYATSEDDVANDMYNALQQFFNIFTELKANDFYITGESYAGKYVPSIAYKIHTSNLGLSPSARLPLSGFVIGDGMMSPLNQIPGYSQLLFDAGMASLSEAAYILEQETAVIKNIKSGDLVTAFHIFDALINGDFTGYLPYVANISGFTNYFNLANPDYPGLDYNGANYASFISRPDIQSAIHLNAGAVYASYNKSVEQALIPDWMKGVEDKVIALLDNDYRALIYSGQYDVILSAPACQRFLNVVAWKGLDGFNKASKSVWQIDDDPTGPAGYVQAYENLNYVVVRGAGHILPLDQPRRALDMITRFVDNKGWN